MRYLKTLALGAVMVAGSTLSIQAQELHFIMCGGEIRDADQTVVDAFTAANPGVTVNIEAVP